MSPKIHIKEIREALDALSLNLGEADWESAAASTEDIICSATMIYNFCTEMCGVRAEEEGARL